MKLKILILTCLFLSSTVALGADSWGIERARQRRTERSRGYSSHSSRGNNTHRYTERYYNRGRYFGRRTYRGGVSNYYDRRGRYLGRSRGYYYNY